MNNQSSSSSFFFTIKALRKSALAILELSVDASIFEVKAQYRKLALKYYPDKVIGEEEKKMAAYDKFSKISAAYELLLNDDCREENMMNSVLCATSFTDPYQLFEQHCFVDITTTKVITKTFRRRVLAVSSAQSERKRTIEGTVIIPPVSPVSTALYDEYTADCPVAKRIKVVDAPSPSILMRGSVKRDSSWVGMTADENYLNSLQLNPKRRRTTVLG